MKSLHRPVRRLFAIAFMSAAVMSCGCRPFAAPATSDAIPAGTPQFMVQMKGEGWKEPTMQKFALSENIFVDDVLTMSKAKQKFRNMKIEIHRIVPETNRPHKMEIEYRARTKNIPAEQNYAIHPNDRVLIKQVVETPLDQFVDSMFPGQNN